MNLNLLPISYWHEFLDMIFFFKVVTGTIRVSPSVIPQVLVTRTTRSNSNRNVTHFISRKCNTVTFQRSFFNRTTRIWNTLVNDLQLSCNLQTSTTWMPYNVTTTQRTNDPGKQSVRHATFHVTCLSVSVVVFNFLMLVLPFLTYLSELWDHCNWFTAVVAPLPIKHLFVSLFTNRRS